MDEFEGIRIQSMGAIDEGTVWPEAEEGADLSPEPYDAETLVVRLSHEPPLRWKEILQEKLSTPRGDGPQVTFQDTELRIEGLHKRLRNDNKSAVAISVGLTNQEYRNHRGA